MFEALSTGSAPQLMAFIFFVGGAFEIIMESGAASALCAWVVSRLRARRAWIVPVFVGMFSVFGFTMGLTTASIVFLPLGMAAAKSLGYDEETGMAMVMLGTNAGFAAGIYNPFSVGIAQTIAELPLYSGAWLRWLLLAVLVPVTGAYIVRRAGKPALSGEAVLLADALCLSRQSAVLAFQLGDGLTNLVSPVSSTLVSCLAISGVSYPKWIRYFLPLVGLYLTVGTAFMLLAGAVGY